MRTHLFVTSCLAAALVCSAQVTITEFPLPAGASVPAPVGITIGPDGNLWFTEINRQKLARITTAGVVTEIPTSTSRPPFGIATGSDGNLWFTEGNLIGRMTTAGVLTEFPMPSGGGSTGSIVAGPDGNLWFVEEIGNQIGRITTAGVITEFPLPVGGSRPTGIAAGADGNLWFTESSLVNKIGRITTGGAITEFSIPTGNSGPYMITAGPDGNLWFTENLANKIGRITTTGAITEFPIPAGGGGPTGITAGPDGNVWFADWTANKIANITPAGLITEFSIPTPGSGPQSLAAGPDGNIWFTEILANKIGKALLSVLSRFPLKGSSPGADQNLTAYTAQISSVFDHSMGTPYQQNDKNVQSFTAEIGDVSNSQDCWSQAGLSPFTVTGHYVGTTGTGGSSFLCYAGHPGFDYPALDETEVYATVSGTIRYPAEMVGLRANVADRTMDVLELIPDDQSDLRIYHLHLATHPVCLSDHPTGHCLSGQPIAVLGPSAGCPAVLPPPATDAFGSPTHVGAGCLIGKTGHSGTGGPHLHFEVQRVVEMDQATADKRKAFNCKEGPELGKACVPVDPYGWAPLTGSPTDPYLNNTGVENRRLW